MSRADLTEEDVQRIVHEYIKDNLSIEVKQSDGGFTDPNGRKIVVKLGKEVVASTHFTMEVRREYEG